MGLEGWKYIREIQINSGSTGLQDYVFRLKLNSNNFDFSKPKPDGSDIRFVDSDGITLLDYYIEDYDYDNQKATIYVKIPSIPANQTKLIYIYYGNINATSQSDESVMTSGFQYSPDPFNDGSCLAFYPLDGDANDYSGNGHHGTWYGNEKYDDGIFSQCAKFDGSSGIDILSRSETESILITDFSFSIFAKITDLVTNSQIPISFGASYSSSSYPNEWEGFILRYLTDDHNFHLEYLTTTSPYKYEVKTDIDSFGSFIHFVGIHSGNNKTISLYVNGVHVGTTAYDGTRGTFDHVKTAIGCGVNGDWDYSHHSFFIGSVDHVHIFNRTLSDDEIKALSNRLDYTISDELLQSKLSGVIYDKYRRRIRNKQVKIFIIDKDSGNLYGTTTSSNDGTWDISLPISPDTKVLTVIALEGEYHGDVDIAGAEFDITKNL